ncbi:MAG TPA: hypothetical protein VKO42_02380 [Patescibacteria group bacterium]|nr:hypothetical protein [Patescibacteria group bacterium]
MESRPAIIAKEEITHEELVDIIKAADSSFGHMGSGGFEVRAFRCEHHITIVVFFACDCAPTPAFGAIIKENVVYSQSAAGIISDILRDCNISHEFQPQAFISSELLLAWERIKASF